MEREREREERKRTERGEIDIPFLGTRGFWGLKGGGHKRERERERE